MRGGVLCRVACVMLCEAESWSACAWRDAYTLAITGGHAAVELAAEKFSCVSELRWVLCGLETTHFGRAGSAGSTGRSAFTARTGPGLLLPPL